MADNKYLTAQGLIIQRLNDILLTQKEEAVRLFQDLAPGEEIDTSANTTIGRLISLVAPSTADLWEALQEVDSAFDPDKAKGIALDNIVALSGISRLGEQKAVCNAILTGNAGVVIPYNSAIRGNGTNKLWLTRTPVTLSSSLASGAHFEITTVANAATYQVFYSTPAGTQILSYTSDGSATLAEIKAGLIANALLAPHNDYITVTSVGTSDTLQVQKISQFVLSLITVSANLTITKWQQAVQLQAEEAGPIEQPIGTITNIATPVLNWDSCINYSAAIGGKGVETDEELRLRFRDTKYEKANNILEALYSAMISTPGVNQVVIYENDTNTTDVATTTPPHSFYPIYSGTATEQEVAEVIWRNKPIGILSYKPQGTMPVDFYPTGYNTVLDSQGFPHFIGVNKAIAQPIYISMTLDTDSNYPSNGNDLIKAAIVNYLLENTGIGDDILYTRLFTPINNVPGHFVTSLTIGTTASPVGTSNIVIPYDKIYTLDTANIVITII
jgi:uncharacterized phage protein gp47/JayE